MTNNLPLCFLGLGSNLSNELGTPKQHMLSAIAQFVIHPHIQNISCSNLYISKPYGVTDQPDFVNAVVSCETNLTPQELLTFCQSLEHKAGRQRLRHWGERSLDVDILLYGNEQITTKELTVPHIEIEKRNFVLVPLVELTNKLNIELQINGTSLYDLPLSQDWTGLTLTT